MTTTPTALRPDEGIALFTDGSSWHKDRSGGWAWVAVDAYDGFQARSGYHADTTNNQMELLAPAHGLLWLYKAYGPCNVLVQSDSQYVVFGITDSRRKRNVNSSFWIALEAATNLHSTVEFCHVKGHNDHYWNELVDDLAGKARVEGRTNRAD